VFNRRTHVRVHPRPGEPVEVQITGDDFIDMFVARDISCGGLGVDARHLVTGSTTGAKVELVIKLPRQKAFIARGTIRNVSRQGILGIEFTDLPPAERARIQHYVESRLAQGGAAA
jgi:hypothetical protein